MKLWRIDGGSTEWVIAETAEQAAEIHRVEYLDLMDLDADDIGEYDAPCEVAADAFLTIDLDDGSGVTRLAASEWVNRAAGKPQFLASSEY